MGAGRIAIQRLWNLAPLFSAVPPLVSVAHAQQRQSALQAIDALVPSRYDFGLPAWPPRPMEPAANPTTPARVEMGRYLFCDTRSPTEGLFQFREFSGAAAISSSVSNTRLGCGTASSVVSRSISIKGLMRPSLMS